MSDSRNTVNAINYSNNIILSQSGFNQKNSINILMKFFLTRGH